MLEHSLLQRYGARISVARVNLSHPVDAQRYEKLINFAGSRGFSLPFLVIGNSLINHPDFSFTAISHDLEAYWHKQVG